MGIRHGAPHAIFHPDVPKQVLVARAVYKGHVDSRRLYHDDIRFTLYPYGTAAILGNALRAYSAVTGRDLDRVHRWQWALRLRYLAVALFLAASSAVAVFEDRPLLHAHPKITVYWSGFPR